jgi:hypothetical protein
LVDARGIRPAEAAIHMRQCQSNGAALTSETAAKRFHTVDGKLSSKFILILTKKKCSLFFIRFNLAKTRCQDIVAKKIE